MQERFALDVLVAVAEAPLVVVWVAPDATEREAGAGKVFPEADVECHVAGVHVHIQPQVFSVLPTHTKVDPRRLAHEGWHTKVGHTRFVSGGLAHEG